MLHCFIRVAEKFQLLFMSAQSDLYDTMFDWSECKEQVTTSDPYHRQIPLCLTEHSSLAIKYNPPNRHLLPRYAYIYTCDGQLSKMRGKASWYIRAMQLCCQICALQRVAASLWVQLSLGSRLLPAEDSLRLPAPWPKGLSLPFLGEWGDWQIEPLCRRSFLCSAWPWENVSPFVKK